MKKKLAITLLILILALICPASTFAQSPVAESRTKVGGLKLPDGGYGMFGTAPHDNKDSTFTGYENYYARFSLWVGAVTSEGEILVTAGTGNEITGRSEWASKDGSFTIQNQTGFQQVEKIASTEYSDAILFESHKPLGLSVKQDVYGFSNRNFTVIDFHISLDSNAMPLQEMYVGFWADVDASDSLNKITADDDKVGFTPASKAPFVFDGKRAGTEIPLLGATILGTDEPIISWWKVKEFPRSNEEQYTYLKDEGKIPVPDELGDYHFLLSFGPFTLDPGETFRFPVTIVQAPQVSDFEDSINDATEFFTEELGGVLLKKASSDVSMQLPSLQLLPQSFHLYQNFPNPFNPQTQIQFDLPEVSHVELRIYSTLGQLVRTLVDKPFQAGRFSVIWDGKDDDGRLLSSGIYVYRIQADTYQAQRKLLLLK